MVIPILQKIYAKIKHVLQIGNGDPGDKKVEKERILLFIGS